MKETVTRSETTVKTEVTVAVIPDMTQETEQGLTEVVESMEEYAGGLNIQTEEDFKKAGEFGRTLKQKMSEVTEFFKPMKDSAYKAHRQVCDREKTMLAPLKNAETKLKKAMKRYTDQVEEKRRREEELLRKAARREAEAKLAEAVELEKAGNNEAAEEAFVEASVMDDATAYVVRAPVKPKANGVTTSKDWEIVEIQTDKVPVSINGTEIRPVDRAAVMRLIRSSKGQVQIPGIVYKETSKFSFRR